MSETAETTSSASAQAAEDGFNQRAAVLIAGVAVLAALVTSLQTNAGAQSAQASRDAQRYAIQAMGQKTGGQARVSYDRQGALQTWSELNDLALASDTLGDEPAAVRYRDVRDRIAGLSRLLAQPYFDAETQSWPDISAYEADVYLVATTELSERYADATARFDAWGDKANTYVVHLTLLAVALALFGLSTTIASRTRRLFIVVGLGLVATTLVWAGLNFFKPAPGLPEEAIRAYARGVGLAYQDKAEKAITAFDEALTQAPDYPNALYERGNAHYQLAEYEVATADYEKARAAGRDDTNVGWNLGWTYYLLGKFEDAKRADLRVLEMDPSLIGVRLNLGLARLAAGENAAAKSDYDDAMQAAAQIVTEAKAAGQEPPSSLWFYLDAGSVDLQNLIDRLNDRDRDWTQAPSKQAVGDPDSVQRIAQETIDTLKSLTTALEFTGRPPEGTAEAEIGEFSFGQAVYDENGEFVKYETAGAYAYRTKEVLVLFDYERMKVDQDVLFKVTIDGQEYTPLRQVVKWPETLGEAGTAQYPISYAYSKIFILPVGEYVVEMYVDSRLAQAGRFEVKRADALLGGDSGSLLFQDSFSDPISGWQRSREDDFISDYADGAYQIHVVKESLAVHAVPSLVFGDVSIDVDAARIGGPDDGSLGVLCRYQDADNYYLGQISGDGYAGIYKRKAGEWTLLGADELAFSEAILQGDQANHLRFECSGSAFTLYVNDQLVAEQQDGDFASGDVGLQAGTYETGGTDILFDNFVVRQPGAAPAPPSDNTLFADDFGDPSSGWARTEESDFVTDYTDGGYRIYVSRDNYSVWSTPGLDLGDVSIDVVATKVAGPDDGNFGIVCRYLDADNFYLLAITGEGEYAIARRKGGEWSILGADSFQFSDAIRPGDATNAIHAECVGSTLSLAVNDELLIEVEDADFVSGDAGLLAGTDTAGGVDILFDDFVVTQP